MAALFLAFAVGVHAQTTQLVGEWLMTRAESKGRVQEPYFITEFKDNGKLLVMGIDFGTWTYDPSGKTVRMSSKMDKDFNGRGKILKRTNKELVINLNEVTYFYTRIKNDEIKKANEKSKLQGLWKIQNNEGVTKLLRFNSPDDFVFLTASEGMTDTYRGTWIFDPSEKTVIMVGLSKEIKGKIEIKELTDTSLVLENHGKLIQATKENPNAQKIEHLTFVYEDFPEETDGIESALPWRDFDAMVSYLENVHSLKYRRGVLLEAVNSLRYDTILSKVAVNPEKPRVRFTNLRITQSDTMQYSEKVKGNLMESFNDFFPREEPSPYRIAGVESVTVPAGTFMCTVVEGFDGEKKVKLWMINDKPGVYAKIIREEKDVFDHLDYSVQELVAIQ